jgi:hypothetical protein
MHYYLYMADAPYIYAFYISAANVPILIPLAYQKLEEPMSGLPLDWARRPNAPAARATDAKSSPAKVPTGLRVASAVLRTIFILALLVIIALVSKPQSESIWTVYETPADLIRVILGFAVFAWIAVQLFILPKDAQAHRTWLYLGMAGVPFALICAAALWWRT